MVSAVGGLPEAKLITKMAEGYWPVAKLIGSLYKRRKGCRD